MFSISPVKAVPLSFSGYASQPMTTPSFQAAYRLHSPMGGQDIFVRNKTLAVQSQKTGALAREYPSLFFAGKRSRSSSPFNKNSPTTSTASTPEVATPEELVKVADIPYKHTVSPRYADPQKGLNPLQTYNLLKNEEMLAVGDLHASIHKLVEEGVVAGLIKMPPKVLQQFIKTVDDNEYTYLKNYEEGYDRPDNLPKLIKTKQTLDQLIPQMQWRDKNRTLILIGDVLGDRSAIPDESTLDLINHLSQQCPKAFIRMASNHDHSVLQFLRNRGPSVYDEEKDKDSSVYPAQWDKDVYIWSEQCRSLLHALAIAKENGTLPALRAKYFNYLKQSKLLYFDDQTNTLFAHARIKQEDLQKLYNFLIKLGYSLPNEVNQKELKAFIEKANQAYQKYVADTEAGRASPEEHQAWDQFLCSDDGFLWTRQPHRQSSDLPAYPIVQALVHGHDSNNYSPYEVLQEGEKAKEFPIFNLDQQVRYFGTGWGENLIYTRHGVQSAV